MKLQLQHPAHSTFTTEHGASRCSSPSLRWRSLCSLWADRIPYIGLSSSVCVSMRALVDAPKQAFQHQSEAGPYIFQGLLESWVRNKVRCKSILYRQRSFHWKYWPVCVCFARGSQRRGYLCEFSSHQHQCDLTVDPDFLLPEFRLAVFLPALLLAG